MNKFLIAAALSLPFLASPALAAGGGDEKAPETPTCVNGKIYDKKTKKCVTAQDSKMDVDGLYENLRQLAHAGRYDDALTVLAQMPQDDDRTLTYLGFTHRKLGQTDLAMDYYTQALRVNPANVLARSYMGQGFVEQGNIAAAMDQLRAIRAHGGTGTWAEASLRNAIATGRTYSY